MNNRTGGLIEAATGNAVRITGGVGAVTNSGTINSTSSDTVALERQALASEEHRRFWEDSLGAWWRSPPLRSGLRRPASAESVVMPASSRRLT